MSISATPTSQTFIPADITAKIQGLTERLRKSAVEHFAAEDADVDGPFTNATSGINLDRSKWCRPGHIMRQTIDCKLVDEFATWLSNQTEAESSCLPSIIPSSVRQFFGLTSQRKIVISRFLTEYMEGKMKIDRDLTEYLSKLKLAVRNKTLSADNDNILTSTSEHRIVNPHDTFFDTLIAASNPGDLKPATGLGEETIRLVSMYSSKARQTFWSDAATELREEFLQEKGWTIGAWPDLPEGLRKVAKGQASELSAAEAESTLPAATEDQTLRQWVHKQA